MSIYGAMFAGVSALNAHSQAIGIISDNIANINTPGFKETEARFSTLVTSGATDTSFSPGGIKSRPFQLVDQQGLLQASSSPTDLAISGGGFFVVNEAAVPVAGNDYLYTRAGAFSVDKGGYMVNTAGYFLQGWPTLPNGSFDVDQNGVADAGTPDPVNLTNMKSIRVSALTGSPTPTSTVDIGLNLPATAAVAATNDLTARVFDSLGVAHNVALRWTKTVASPATWGLTATGITQAASGAASTTGITFPVTLNTVVFAGTGLPSSFTPVALAVSGAQWVTGAAASSVAFNLGTVNQADGVTQFASTYSINFLNQNGSTSGRFQTIEVDKVGAVTALFDNGNKQTIFKLPIGTFPNPNALRSRDGNAWAETTGAGNHFLNVPGSGAAGLFAPSSVEASTVDLGEEFTDMITTQRAYSATTRIITTVDQMLEELVRIKR